MCTYVYFRITLGFNPEEAAGRTVVIHDSSGTRVSCAELGACVDNDPLLNKLLEVFLGMTTTGGCALAVPLLGQYILHR